MYIEKDIVKKLTKQEVINILKYERANKILLEIMNRGLLTCEEYHLIDNINRKTMLCDSYTGIHVKTVDM